MQSIKQRIEKKMEVLTKVERRHFHIPEKAKVSANVVGDELSAECCGNLWSKFKIPHTKNGWTPEIPNARFSATCTGFKTLDNHQLNLNSSRRVYR